MRCWKGALAVISLAFLTVTVVAQQGVPTSQEQDVIDKAHTDLLKTNTNKAAEAGRLTEAVAKALPQTAFSNTPISRKNFIDQQIFSRIEQDQIPHAPLAGDEEFLRRAYLDATGLLPTPTKVREFIESKDPDKRDKLIDSLIGTDEFAEQWAWLWSDLLQTHNDAFSYWFKKGLKRDRPYNEMAK